MRTGSRYAIPALDFMFERVAFTVPALARAVGSSPATASGLVGVMRVEGSVQEIKSASGNRPAVFVFHELYKVVEETGNVKSR